MMGKTTAEESTAGKVIFCKAAVAWSPGEKLSIEDVDVAPPQAGEVRIRISHTAICRSDLTFLRSEAMRPLFPRIFGHEAAGVVESVGDGVTDLKPGDHVLPVFTGECKQCDYCKSGKTNLCEIFSVNPLQSAMLGDSISRFSINGQAISRGFTSTFSEYTVVERGYVVKINPAAPLGTVLLLACGAATGIGAVWNIAKAEPESSVAIFGLGALGMGVAEGARVAGCKRIIGVDTDNSKFEKGKIFGITDFLNPNDSTAPVEKIIADMTRGGVDYAFECIGEPVPMKAAFNSCHRGGGLVVVLGVAPRGIPMEVDPGELLRGKSVVGSMYGGWKPQTDIPELVEKYLRKEFQLEPFITHRLPFSEINTAIELLERGESLRTVLQL